MVSATGVPTPLAQANGTWADVGVRFAYRTVTPQLYDYSAGLIRSMVHLPTSKYTYVAGQFNIAGNVPVSGIARYNWNSKTWHDVAGGVEGFALTMAQENEKLYVGGGFTYVGNIRANYVAVFNMITEKWSALNMGLDNVVTKLFFYNGKLTALEFSQVVPVLQTKEML